MAHLRQPVRVGHGEAGLARAPLEVQEELVPQRASASGPPAQSPPIGRQVSGPVLLGGAPRGTRAPVVRRLRRGAAPTRREVVRSVFCDIGSPPSSASRDGSRTDGSASGLVRAGPGPASGSDGLAEDLADHPPHLRIRVLAERVQERGREPRAVATARATRRRTLASGSARPSRRWGSSSSGAAPGAGPAPRRPPRERSLRSIRPRQDPATAPMSPLRPRCTSRSAWSAGALHSRSSAASALARSPTGAEAVRIPSPPRGGRSRSSVGDPALGVPDGSATSWVADASSGASSTSTSSGAAGASSADASTAFPVSGTVGASPTRSPSSVVTLSAGEGAAVSSGGGSAPSSALCPRVSSSPSPESCVHRLLGLLALLGAGRLGLAAIRIDARRGEPFPQHAPPARRS